MVAAAGPLIFLAITGVLALGLLWWGFHSLKRKRLIENVPTSKVKGVFLGLNEVKGRAHRDEPFLSYLAQRHCVYYRYEVKERWSRTEHYTDSEGRSKTRTNSGWKTVASHEERRPFQLIDSTGALRVVPHRAEISADKVFDEHCSRHDPLYYGKGPSSSISNSDHRRHFVEHAIPLDARIYVLGPARLRDDKVEPEIAWERGAELFLISTKGERQLKRGYTTGAFFKLLVGTAAAFLFPVGFARARRRLRKGAGAAAARRAPRGRRLPGGDPRLLPDAGLQRPRLGARAHGDGREHDRRPAQAAPCAHSATRRLHTGIRRARA
jgi:hypothetical protein